MRAISFVAGGVTGILLAQAALADCQCLGNGLRYDEGDQVCLRLPTGPQLARCEKVLNNSSWKLLGSACQLTASNEQSWKSPSQFALQPKSGEPHPPAGQYPAAPQGLWNGSLFDGNDAETAP
ncbi:hypothetical protein [Paramesorhizobium deserti]|uniref:hypothetical protein n=1 Tax=Paramesorhizobium deserti TaxID=1494590 RepID=UPI00137982DB|nr:hypothetical protein [Paramesorhizobium deserti]